MNCSLYVHVKFLLDLEISARPCPFCLLNQSESSRRLSKKGTKSVKEVYQITQ